MNEEMLGRLVEALERIADAAEMLANVDSRRRTTGDPLAHFWAANPDARKKFDELMAQKKDAA